MESFDLNVLASNLAQIINNRTNYFEKINILVPSEEVGTWFKEYYIKNNNSVLMNVAFITFNKLLYSVYSNITIIDDVSYKLLIMDTLKELNFVYLDKNSLDYSNKLYDLTNLLFDLFNSYDDTLDDLNSFQKEIYDLVLKKAHKKNMYSLREVIENSEMNNIGHIYTFGFVHISNLTSLFLDKYADITRFDLKERNFISKEGQLVNASSKKREIEYVHSLISQLLLDETNKYRDFYILAPNISEYRSEINQVFNQDNIKYPYIPYTIKESETNLSQTYDLLKTLFSICTNNTFTRLDFANLINNKLIQKKYNIDQDTKDLLIKLVALNNVYEDNLEINLDFNEFKKRILLSKFLEYSDEDNNIVTLDKTYKAYNSISLTNDVIVIYSKLINDVSSFISLFKNINVLDLTNIDILWNNISLFLDLDGKEYLKLNKFINQIKYLDINLDKEILKNFVLSLIKFEKSNMTKPNIGLTFASFNKDIVLNYKYVFFIGLTSNNFPPSFTQSELDLRKNMIEESLKEIVDSFLLTYQNSVYFYASYTGLNLKTDEEYYPSTILDKIDTYKNIIDNKKIINMPLDETRDWSYLFTNSEFNNKLYNLNLMNEKSESRTRFLLTQNEKLKVVKLSEMSQFLQDNFMFKVKKLFPYNSDLYERIRSEFMPFKVDTLDKSDIVYEVCLYIIKNNIDINDNNSKDKFVKTYSLNHKIPTISNTISQMCFDTLWSESFKIKDLIYSYGIPEIISPEITISDSLVFSVVSRASYVRVSNENSRSYFELKYKDKIEEKDYTNLYILSLIDVALKNNDTTYHISLVKNEKNVKSFEINSYEARDLLVKIYNDMFDYSHIYSLPIESIKKKPNDFYEFIKSLQTDMGAYAYFSDKKMFNFQTDLGYSDETFEKEFNSNLSHLKSLIKYSVED